MSTRKEVQERIKDQIWSTAVRIEDMALVIQKVSDARTPWHGDEDYLPIETACDVIEEMSKKIKDLLKDYFDVGDGGRLSDEMVEINQMRTYERITKR